MSEQKARPVVVVSRCLEFEPVRYNGQIMPCPLVKDLEPYVDYIKVCPEYEVGLGVPRDPIRIVKINGEKRLIQPRTNKDITDTMHTFTTQFINSLPEVDGFIFKADSPTIGLRNIKVYSGIEKAPVVERGRGFFAQQIFDQYQGYPMEEDNRLRNNIIRYHFLIHLFTFAHYRHTINTNDKTSLETFHKNNTYLFSLYNPDFIKLGQQLIQNASTLNDTLKQNYLTHLKKIMTTHPTSTDYLRVWKDIITYFGNKLTIQEKNFINTIFDKYQRNKICHTGVTDLLRSYTYRFPDEYIEHQTIFTPFPDNLLPNLEPDRDKNYWK